MGGGGPPGALPLVSAKVGNSQGGGCVSALVVAVVVILLSEYVFYVSFDLRPWLWPQVRWKGVVAAVWFHLIFVLACVAYVQSVRTDPGTIPRHWGFHTGDVAKRKRYCRECHRWKPDRTHHCSACRKCVLAMDHHCPWINNCVGFYNRKFFLQLLVFGLIGLGTVFLHSLARIVRLLWTQFALTDGVDSCLQLGGLVVSILFISMTGFLFVALAQFLRFHLSLATSNLTTIENLDAVSRQIGRYDVGKARNLAQILGPVPLLWWWPAHTQQSFPSGDGVRFPLSEAAVLALARLEATK